MWCERVVCGVSVLGCYSIPVEPISVAVFSAQGALVAIEGSVSSGTAGAMMTFVCASILGGSYNTYIWLENIVNTKTCPQPTRT